MLRGLLPVNLVITDDPVGDSFVSFLDFTELCSSTAEEYKQSLMPSYQGKIPLTFTKNDRLLSAIAADKPSRIMYVCGMVAADFSDKDSSLEDGQPRFLQSIPPIKEYITITYVLNPKRHTTLDIFPFAASQPPKGVTPTRKCPVVYLLKV